MNGRTIRTFLGANSEKGFYSLYPQFTADADVYVIKGGPGSGKSGMMKKIAAAACAEGYFTEYCYCSSDAESLDGVRIPERGICILDGTPPHTFEPRLPGVRDVMLNTGRFWDRALLRGQREEIEAISEEIRKEFARTYRFLASAGQGAEEARLTALRRTDADGIRTLARSLLRRHGKTPETTGRLHPRFLSGISPQGYVTNKDTIYTLCDKVFPLRDRYGLSDLFLEEAAQYANDRNSEAYLFYDPLQPDRLRHVALPGEGIAFVTCDRQTNFEPQNAYRIDLKRFTDLSTEETALCKRAATWKEEALKGALEALAREKAYHDDLEEYYVTAMDFRKLDRYTATVIREIFP